MQDIGSSVKVGVENYSARLADEGRALPLTFDAVSASGAGLGCIFGSDEFHSNTSFFSFVDKELFQLVERPIGEEPILFSPMSCFSDAFKVLQDDNPILTCAIYQASADNMVAISHKTLLLSPDYRQMSCGGTSAFALQPASQSDVFSFDRKSVRAIYNPTIGGSDNVIDTPINSDSIAFLIRDNGGLLYGNHQAEFSIPAFDEIAFLDFPSNKLSEVFWDVDFEFHPTIFSENTRRTCLEINGAASAIIMGRCAREYRKATTLLFERGFEGGAGVFIGDNSKLRRKIETLTKNRIIEMVHPEGVGFLMFLTGSNDEVLRLSHAFQHFIKNYPLFGCFFNKRLESFHHNLVMLMGIYKGFARNILLRFLPRMNSWVSSQVFI